MSDIGIRVEKLGKLYRIGKRQEHHSLREAVTSGFSAPFRKLKNRFSSKEASQNYIWALKDISFELKRGEVVGIIGPNGAGKTTLLKILSRITPPTEGYAEVYSRVASLLEVGTGFHPELTGRDNIYMNGVILGMKKTEIDRKFDEIVAFAEIERFIDTPVKHYSSGMYLRLAFSVAAHLEPEILLVDEVLAVGDIQFQKKCLGKMGEITKEGRTVLFVSHNMGAISELCSHAILINQGKKVMLGPVVETIDCYSKILRESESPFNLSEDPSLPCSIIDLRLSNGARLESTTFDLNDEIIITIIYSLKAEIKGFHIVITLSRHMVDILHSYDVDNLKEIPPRGPGIYQTQLKIPHMFLKGGSYSITIVTTDLIREYQWINSALNFEIKEISQNTYRKSYRSDRPGYVIFPGVWQTKKLN